MKRPNIYPLGPTNFENSNDIASRTYEAFSQGTDALLGFKPVKGPHF